MFFGFSIRGGTYGADSYDYRFFVWEVRDLHDGTTNVWTTDVYTEVAAKNEVVLPLIYTNFQLLVPAARPSFSPCPPPAVTVATAKSKCLVLQGTGCWFAQACSGPGLRAGAMRLW